MESPRFEATKMVLCAVVTFVLIAGAQLQWCANVIEDGSIYENSRWSRIHLGYSVIPDDDSVDHVFVGSSRTYTAIDGECIEEHVHGDERYWNFAMRSDIPYFRQIELNMMLASDVEHYIFEVSDIYLGSGIAIQEYRIRLSVTSFFDSGLVDPELETLFTPFDQEWILDSNKEHLDFLRDSSYAASEEAAYRLLNGDGSYDSLDGHLPEPDDEEFIASLKNPPSSDFNLDETRVDWEDIVEISKGRKGEPSLGQHRNRVALEHMASEVIMNGAQVSFLIPPTHDDLASIDNRSMDQSIDLLIDELTHLFPNALVLDLRNESYPQGSFHDPTHLTELGSQIACMGLARQVNQEL